VSYSRVDWTSQFYAFLSPLDIFLSCVMKSVAVLKKHFCMVKFKKIFLKATCIIQYISKFHMCYRNIHIIVSFITVKFCIIDTIIYHYN
jgi:hypothetical protein